MLERPGAVMLGEPVEPSDWRSQRLVSGTAKGRGTATGARRIYCGLKRLNRRHRQKKPRAAFAAGSSHRASETIFWNTSNPAGPFHQTSSCYVLALATIR